MPTTKLSIPDELTAKIAEIISQRVEERLVSERRDWFILLAAIIERYGEIQPGHLHKSICIPDNLLVGAEGKIDILPNRSKNCTVYRLRPEVSITRVEV